MQVNYIYTVAERRQHKCFWILLQTLIALLTWIELGNTELKNGYALTVSNNNVNELKRLLNLTRWLLNLFQKH